MSVFSRRPQEANYIYGITPPPRHLSVSSPFHSLPLYRSQRIGPPPVDPPLPNDCNQFCKLGDNIRCHGYLGALFMDQLSCYQLGEYILLDAGSTKIYDSNIMENIKVIFVTHSHLDHIAGLLLYMEKLILNPPVETPSKKYIVSDLTANYLADKIFQHFFDNSSVDVLTQNIEEYFIFVPQNNLDLINTIKVGDWKLVGANPLSHKDYGVGDECKTTCAKSMAYTFRKGKEYVVYFGDFSIEPHENGQHTEMFNQVVQTVPAGETVVTVLMECAFPKAPNEQMTFGHLNNEMFNKCVGIFLEHRKNASFFVTHRKPTLKLGEKGIQYDAESLKSMELPKVTYIDPKVEQIPESLINNAEADVSGSIYYNLPDVKSDSELSEKKSLKSLKDCLSMVVWSASLYDLVIAQYFQKDKPEPPPNLTFNVTSEVPERLNSWFDNILWPTSLLPVNRPENPPKNGFPKLYWAFNPLRTF